MRKLIGLAVVAATFLLSAGWPAKCHAQMIWWGESDRAVRPGAYVPYDGAPFSHRYNYYTGPSFYLNGDPSKFAYLEYLDRVDRAEKFGYRMPANPFVTAPRCVPCGR